VARRFGPAFGRLEGAPGEGLQSRDEAVVRRRRAELTLVNVFINRDQPNEDIVRKSQVGRVRIEFLVDYYGFSAADKHLRAQRGAI
jgi:hypothetical protein